MALSHKLELRQSQSLVMTPQLMQAIKLLQLSNLDLIAYVEAELERNPLLERGEARTSRGAAPATGEAADVDGAADDTASDGAGMAGRPRLDARCRGDRRPSSTPTSPMSFPDDHGRAAGRDRADAAGRKLGDGAVAPARSAPRTTISKPSSPSEKSLADHLSDQLGLAVARPGDRASSARR